MRGEAAIIEGFAPRVRRALEDAGAGAELLDRVRRASRGGQERPVIAAARLGLMDGARLADALSRAFEMPRAEPQAVGPTPTPSGLSALWLKRRRMAPIRAGDEDLPLIGVVDPSDADALKACAFACRGAVRFAVLSLEEWSRTSDESAGGEISSGLEGRDHEALADLSRGAPAVRAVEEALAAARRAGASDVHVRPEEDGLKIFIRVDGDLKVLRTYPLSLAAPVAARLKVLAGLDLAERRAPQDGRLSFAADGAMVDARLSTVPNAWGESAVVRLLGRSADLLSFSGLGFSEDQERTMARWLDRRSGMVVVAGPTGAGKTTTLYAAINALRGSGRNILTVEDPVEYLFEGVSQTQVDRAAGVDFSTALRAFLRHDPDVVMVGEIRDAETAALAVRAALTGHLVLTSIHAESAAAAAVRLRDLGVEPFLAASTLTGIAAQRLTRRLCGACRGEGCGACGDTGRRGRIAIVEMLDIDEPVRRAILDGADADAIAKAGQEQRHSNLEADARTKAEAGLVERAEALTSVS